MNSLPDKQLENIMDTYYRSEDCNVAYNDAIEAVLGRR